MSNKRHETRESHGPLTVNFLSLSSKQQQRYRQLIRLEFKLGVLKRQFRLYQQRRARLDAELQAGIEAFFKKQSLEFHQKTSKYLHAYTKDDKYSQVNAALRSSKVSSAPQDIRDIIEGGTKALNTGLFTGDLMPCMKNVLYRGSATLPEAQVPVVGGTWSDKAFLSTSFKWKAAMRFLPTKLPVNKKEPFLFVIKGVTACYIKDYSEYKNEGEFLFRPGTLFRVNAVKRGQMVKGGKTPVTIVEMNEIY